MFGLGRNKKEWSWIAYGKHPAIKDYITIGKEGPFFTALSKWIDGGFRSIKREIVNDFSWRFIATTIDSHLVCGILKNSRDSMNRTFPLLVMGNGYLKDWAVNWSYMPFACEKVWTTAEQITTSNSYSIKELEGRIDQIGKPDENYDNFKDHMVRLKDMNLFAQQPGINRNFMNKLNNIDGVLRNDSFLFNLGSIGMDSLMSLFLLTKFLNVIKNRTPKLPSMIFWGGTEKNLWIFSLKRPLKQEDFRTIWTIDGGEC